MLFDQTVIYPSSPPRTKHSSLRTGTRPTGDRGIYLDNWKRKSSKRIRDGRGSRIHQRTPVRRQLTQIDCTLTTVLLPVDSFARPPIPSRTPIGSPSSFALQVLREIAVQAVPRQLAQLDHLKRHMAGEGY